MTEIIAKSTYTRSQEIGKLMGALAKAQAAMPLAAREAVNEGFKRGNKASTYADLGSVRQACIPHLAAVGIAVLQPVHTEGKTVTVTTILAIDEQYIETSMSVDAKDSSPQALLSATTYLRRGALASLVVVASGDDDDGSAAQHQQQEAPKKQDAPPTQHPRKAAWLEMLEKVPDATVLPGIVADIAKEKETLSSEDRTELLSAVARAKVRLGAA